MALTEGLDPGEIVRFEPIPQVSHGSVSGYSVNFCRAALVQHILKFVEAVADGSSPIKRIIVAATWKA